LKWSNEDIKMLNIKSMMPGLIAEKHDYFLNLLAEKGVSMAMNKRRLVFF
jgi:hypothetical protein